MDVVKRLCKVQNFIMLSRFVVFSGRIYTYHVNKTEYNETSPYDFRGGTHHLSVFSDYIFLQHVSVCSVSSAHILAYQSQRSTKSPLKWSHRIWQLCKWNKDFCASSPAIVSPLGYQNKKTKKKMKRSAHFSRSARMCERQFQTSDRVMDEGSEGHQSSAELSHSSS